MQTQKAFDNFFFVGLGFEFRVCACKAGALPLEAHFRFIVLWYFGDGVLQTICLNWPETAILLVSASKVARITGMIHQQPASS
jgi:hypothetical protein